MMNAAIIGMLIYPALSDIKKKSFCIIWIIIPAAVLAVIKFALEPGTGMLMNECYGMVPGLLAFTVSYALKEAIGKGDCLVILCTGALCGMEMILVVIFIAFAVAGIIGLMLLTFGIKDRKYEIPFVPFLGGAYILVSIWTWR